MSAGSGATFAAIPNLIVSAAGAIVAALSVLLIPGRGREFAAEVHAEAALSA